MRLKSMVLAIVTVGHFYLPVLVPPLIANPELISTARTRATEVPSRERYLRAEDIVSSQEISAMESSSKVAKKLAEIDLLLKQSALSSVDRSKLARVIAFIKIAKHKIGPFYRGNDSIYVHPSAAGVFTPVQFYRNGHIYIHLKRLDPYWKAGGFKHFSRSIDYRKVKLVANLVMHINGKHDVHNFFAELEKMYAVRDEPNLIHFQDLASYVGYSDKVLKQKVAFQTELFAGDLNNMQQELTIGQSLAKAFLGATQALMDLHRYRYYHRDLKPGNFFVRREGLLFSLVLADFGLSQHPNEPNFCRNLAGTRGYIAPELCRASFETGKPCSTWEEVEAADTFALGMTFFNMLMGRDSQLKQRITLLNEVVMPRKNIGPPKNLSLYEALDQVDETYASLAKQGAAAVVGSDHYKQEVFRLVMAAINPQPGQRISLASLKAALAKLLANQSTAA